MQGATRNRLARTLGIKTGHLGKIISAITQISDESYIRSRRLHGKQEGRKAGPPRVYYELIADHFVTFPETAFLLLQLLEFPKELPGRINYADFVQKITGQTSLDEPWISGRIQWAISNDYLVSDQAGVYIGCQERTALERPYLESLANHFASAAA